MCETKQKAIDVGIIDIQCYFPNFYVDQHELEEYDKVEKGKYTLGLGQEKMAISYDREDINSFCLTVIDKLISKNNINKKDIGRIEVGSETFLDKSKSIKTYLMSLFREYNTDIEGVTTSNACYGGTNALLNTIDWVQSEFWDGRYGIVVMGDIAGYEKGNARPTGGCGAVALLIGPNAPIIFEPVRSTYMNHVFDFFKPDPSKEYPVVDGVFSLDCYFKALESCYLTYMNKMKNRQKQYATSLNDFDYFCFHSPFGKMVEKAFVNLVNYEIKRTNNYQNEEEITSNLFCLFSENNQSLITKILTSTDFHMDNMAHNELKNILASRKVIKDILCPSLHLSKNLGNTYVSSLYMNLIALITDSNIDLTEKRIFMFSYGSGCASSLFSLYVKGDYSLIKSRNVDIQERLDNRIKITPDDFEKILLRKEKLFLINNYIPQGSITNLRENTYYLTRVDEKWRRYYSRKSNHCQGMELVSNKLVNMSKLQRLRLLKNQLLNKQ